MATLQRPEKQQPPEIAEIAERAQQAQPRRGRPGRPAAVPAGSATTVSTGAVAPAAAAPERRDPWWRRAAHADPHQRLKAAGDRSAAPLGEAAGHEDDEDDEDELEADENGERGEIADEATFRSAQVSEKAGDAVGEHREAQREAREQREARREPGGKGKGKKAKKQVDHHNHAPNAAGAVGELAEAAGTGASGALGFLSFVKNVRAFGKVDAKQLEGLKGFDAGVEIAGNATQATQGGLSAADHLGNAGARVAGAIDSGNELAETASTAFENLGDGILTMGGSIQTVLSAAHAVSGTVQNIAAFKRGDEMNWGANATQYIATLQGFLGTANNALHVISAFTHIAGVGSELANALPAVGAAVNAAVLVLDILVQTINFIKSMMKLMDAVMNQMKMSGNADAERGAALAEDFASVHGEATGAPAADHRANARMFDHLAEINKKRWMGQLVELAGQGGRTVADLIGIGGSALNIVGVATAPAYGAGVAVMATGYGLTATAALSKVGLALVGPVRKLVRTQKQSGRNAVAGESKGPVAGGFKKLDGILPSELKYDASKSSGKKEQAYYEDISAILSLVQMLPDFDKANPQVVAQYQRVEATVAACGVRINDLDKARDQKAIVGVFMNGLKKRD